MDTFKDITLDRIAKLPITVIATSKIKTTIRESVWSLEQAYNNLIMANQIVHAKKIYSRYRQLASKITPTFLFKEATSVLTLKELPIKIEEEIDENTRSETIFGKRCTRRTLTDKNSFATK